MGNLSRHLLSTCPFKSRGPHCNHKSLVWKWPKYIIFPNTDTVKGKFHLYTTQYIRNKALVVWDSWYQAKAGHMLSNFLSFNHGLKERTLLESFPWSYCSLTVGGFPSRQNAMVPAGSYSLRQWSSCKIPTVSISLLIRGLKSRSMAALTLPKPQIFCTCSSLNVPNKSVSSFPAAMYLPHGVQERRRMAGWCHLGCDDVGDMGHSTM